MEIFNTKVRRNEKKSSCEITFPLRPSEDKFVESKVSSLISTRRGVDVRELLKSSPFNRNMA